MSDNKKYYYLKLKENFYDSEEMIILQNMQDGYLYSDILLKLYLRALKTEGKLMFKNAIPYTPSVLAQVVRHQVGTVERALNIFQELGLIEVLDNGAIYMADIQNFIGESSTEADRKRKYRDKIKQEKLNGTFVRRLSQKCPDKNTPEIEIEKEIDIEIEKEIDDKCAFDKSNGTKTTTKKTQKFTKPSLEEVKDYCRERKNEVDAERFIDYYESNGWRVGRNPMKDWKATVRTWEKHEYSRTKKDEVATTNPFMKLLLEKEGEQCQRTNLLDY